MIEHNRKGVSVENSIWNKKDKFILASKSRFYVYGTEVKAVSSKTAPKRASAYVTLPHYSKFRVIIISR